MADIYIASKTQRKENKQKITSEKKAPISHHVHFFNSFLQNPNNVVFRAQEKDEKILLFLRKHFITNLPWIFISSLLLIAPLLLSLVTSQLASTIFPVPQRFIVILILFYYLIVFTYILLSFINWFYNILIVTQKRIVDIDFSDVVYHDVAVTKLSLIEDVNYTQSGFIRSLFNYGDIFIHTAADKPNFEALGVPHPAKAIDIIQNLIGKEHVHTKPN